MLQWGQGIIALVSFDGKQTQRLFSAPLMQQSNNKGSHLPNVSLVPLSQHSLDYLQESPQLAFSCLHPPPPKSRGRQSEHYDTTFLPSMTIAAVYAQWHPRQSRTFVKAEIWCGEIRCNSRQTGSDDWIVQPKRGCPCGKRDTLQLVSCRYRINDRFNPVSQRQI